jgi:hypothetical protein
MIVKVEWKHVGGKIKGRILMDEMGRTKIAFVGNTHRGRMPKDGEVTEAHVALDNKPKDPRTGVLFVLPVYPPDPDALSEEDAKVKFREMIAAVGLSFDRESIEVNLPGWKGCLRSGFTKHHGPPQPLAADWWFAGEGIRLYSIDKAPGEYTYVITRGITGTPDSARVVNWPLAVHDLGEPESVTVPEYSGRASAVWRDARGRQLRASVECAVAMNAGAQVENVHLNAHADFVVGDIALLGGRWKLKDEYLGTTERSTGRGTVTPALIEERNRHLLTVEQLDTVASLLRSARRSAEWHHARLLRGEIGRDDDASYTLRHEVGQLKRFVMSPFAPPSFAQRILGVIASKRERIEQLLKQGCVLDKGGDPMIYDEAQPYDDSAETAHLLEEVRETLRDTDAEIELYREEADRIVDRLNDPTILARGQDAADKLYARYKALPDDVKNGFSRDTKANIEHRDRASGSSGDPIEWRVEKLFYWLERNEAEIAKAEKSV